MKISKKTVVASLLITAAATVVAEKVDNVKEAFDRYFDFTGMWAGTCADFITLGSAITAPAVGFPAVGTDEHEKVLQVNGEMVCTPTTAPAANAPALVDMMVQAVLPCEALTMPEDVENAQIAVGVDLVQNDDSLAQFKVWCKAPSASAASWVAIGSPVAAESWHRVSFYCDYDNHRCEVRLDGVPQITASGYQQATGNTTTGPWYQFANATSPTKLTGVSVIGFTQLDSLLIQSGLTPAESAESVTGSTGDIPNSWFAANGLAFDGTATVGGEMTAAAKYAASLNPFDNTTTADLKISNLAMSGTTAALTVPATDGSAKIELANNPGFTDSTTVNVSANTTLANVDVGNNDVTYARLKGRTTASANTCGWLKVTSALRNTVIGVPWMEVNSGNAIKVANLVKTDNLTAGDKLYVYIAPNWYLYVLGNNGWEPSTTVSADVAKLAEVPANQTLARGQALFLQRQNPTENSVAKPFWIYGQYSAESVQTTITPGSAEEPSYTLCASPKCETFDLNGSGKITNVGEGDAIVVPQNGGADIVYTFKNGQWGRYVQNQIDLGGGDVVTQNTWSTTAVIPLGHGFWYVSKGGNGSPTIAW